MKPGIDYIGVGVGGAIINEEGKIFIMQRGEKAKNERGKWDLPGGTVDYGQTLQAALKRELKEEFAVDVEVKQLIGVYDHFIADEGQHWVAVCYTCKVVKGDPVIVEPHKCSAIAWLTLEEIQNLPLTITTKSVVSSFQDVSFWEDTSCINIGSYQTSTERFYRFVALRSRMTMRSSY